MRVTQGNIDAVALEAAQVVGVVGELVDVRADLSKLPQELRYRDRLVRSAINTSDYVADAPWKGGPRESGARGRSTAVWARGLSGRARGHRGA